MRRTLLVGLALALAGLVWADEDPLTVPGARNPHGDANACNECHADGSLTPEYAPIEGITDTCRDCHPGAHMHPVERAPGAVLIPPLWPLESGRLTCATCHTEPGHGDVLPAPYLRGGPYATRNDLCYQCHDRGAYTRTDPHHPEQVRSPTDRTCAACHSGIPATGASPEDSRLRYPADKVCEVCHKAPQHLGVETHRGKQAPIERRADLGPEMPLVDGSTIACWTCHEVHTGFPGEALASGRETRRRLRANPQQDLTPNLPGRDWADLQPEGVTWNLSPDTRHPPMLARPVTEMCGGCHGDGPQ